MLYFLAYLLVIVLGFIACAIACAAIVNALASVRNWLRRESQSRKTRRAQ